MIFPQGRPQRPLSCRQVGRLLQAYLDDELVDARRARVAAHLDDCLRCGLDASRYRWLKVRLAELAPRTDERQLARLRVFANTLADEAV
jgi:anti-sigma factor RsiW